MDRPSMPGMRTLGYRGNRFPSGPPAWYYIYLSAYVRPAVNWKEFFRKPGGGSFRKVSSDVSETAKRLCTGRVRLALPVAKYALVSFQAGVAEICSFSRMPCRNL